MNGKLMDPVLDTIVVLRRHGKVQELIVGVDINASDIATVHCLDDLIVREEKCVLSPQREMSRNTT